MASSKGGEVNCCNEDHEHDKTLESKLASVAVELLDEDDEYESLPPSASILVQGMAGSIAGVVEHTCFFPVDVVKTRLHRIRPEPGANYTGAIHGLRTIVAKEGVRGLFNGFGVTALGAGPAHAMYFACYEQAKVAFGASEGPARNPGGVAAAAVVATMVHEGTMTPIEVVKQRLQVHNSPYKGAMDCIRKTLAEEGVAAFYRSFTTQMLMSVPFQITHLVTYEVLKDTLNPDNGYNPSSHMIAGGGAGALAAAITNPFDVAKTLLNTQEQSGVRGVAPAFRAVYNGSGYGGFLKGLSARVALAAPATAVSWTVYEFFKHVLPGHAHDINSEEKCC